jgi:hypothetical protein
VKGWGLIFNLTDENEKSRADGMEEREKEKLGDDAV